MVNQLNVDALMSQSESLKKDYQKAINQQQNLHSKVMTNETVIKSHARITFNEMNHESWQDHAAKQLMSVNLEADPRQDKLRMDEQTARQMADTIESNLVRTNGLVRTARFWQYHEGVDANRIMNDARSEKDMLQTELLSNLEARGVVSNKQTPVLPTVTDDKHAYKTQYVEHERIGEPSRLVHEPEDLDQVLTYIEGFNQGASLKQVIDYQARQDVKITPPVVTYLAEKSHDNPTHKSKIQDFTVSEVEAMVLADARDAGLSVQVVNLRQKQQEQEKSVRMIHDNNKYNHALVKSAIELAPLKDKTELVKLPEMSDNLKLLRRQMVANQVPGNNVGDLREYVHAEAKKQGVFKAVEAVEKDSHAKDARIKSHLQPKAKTTTASQEVDGGRKMGESRPGANRRF